MNVVAGNQPYACSASEICRCDSGISIVVWNEKTTQNIIQDFKDVLVPTCPTKQFSAIMNCPVVEKHSYATEMANCS
jgi:hypothetical protein